MGATDKLFSALKDVMVLSERVKSLDQLVIRLNDKVEFIDRRLVRAETVIEMASKGKMTLGLPENKDG